MDKKIVVGLAGVIMAIVGAVIYKYQTVAIVTPTAIKTNYSTPEIPLETNKTVVIPYIPSTENTVKPVDIANENVESNEVSSEQKIASNLQFKVKNNIENTTIIPDIEPISNKVHSTPSSATDIVSGLDLQNIPNSDAKSNLPDLTIKHAPSEDYIKRKHAVLLKLKPIQEEYEQVDREWQKLARHIDISSYEEIEIAWDNLVVEKQVDYNDKNLDKDWETLLKQMKTKKTSY
ncbi:hypothetical protein QUF74_05085 [Candidatus Halobeggiatoa sp. HSG11]|nr:hypothetical protein [Candidatus Halobeggiatoa sp. HSG11]